MIQKISVKCYAGIPLEKESLPTDGFLLVESWTKTERTKRAIQFGLATLGGMMAAAFVPMLHFILVPGLLIASPFIVQYVYQLKSVLRSGTATCPCCQKSFTIARAPNKSPLEELCEHCRRPVRIEFSNAATPVA